jgi:hypothetical protein
VLPLLMLPPPQPIARPETNTTSSAIITSQLRRRLGTKKKSTARTAPPVDGQNSFRGSFIAVAAVVPTVTVAVAGEAEVTFAEDGLTEQVAGALEAVGVIAQLRLTAPVNPPEGVTEIDDVPLPPRLTVMLPLLLRAKLGDVAEVTFTFTVVVCVIVPDVPVTVTT